MLILRAFGEARSNSVEFMLSSGDRDKLINIIFFFKLKQHHCESAILLDSVRGDHTTAILMKCARW